MGACSARAAAPQDDVLRRVRESDAGTVASQLVEGLDLQMDDYLPHEASNCRATSAAIVLHATGTPESSGVLALRTAPAPTPRRRTQLSLNVDFGPRAKNSWVLVGARNSGTINVAIKQENAVVIIGSDGHFKDLQIRSHQPSDTVIVGNRVSTGPKCLLVSGTGSGEARPSLIVGSDCMFAEEVVVRNTDAHPILIENPESEPTQTDASVAERYYHANAPAKGVCIEPHVWLCQRAAVLKGVTVGANSIVGFGAVVTKDVPRCSVARGIPATSFPLPPGARWARSFHDAAVETATEFLQRFTSHAAESEQNDEAKGTN